MLTAVVIVPLTKARRCALGVAARAQLSFLELRRASQADGRPIGDDTVHLHARRRIGVLTIEGDEEHDAMSVEQYEDVDHQWPAAEFFKAFSVPDYVGGATVQLVAGRHFDGVLEVEFTYPTAARLALPS